MTAQARLIEVQGADDRLGLAAQRESLEHSENARRALTLDLVEARARGEAEVERVREEYERAAEATEARHGREAARWRQDRDRLQKELEGAQAEAKRAKKKAKRAKKSVADLELALAELKESGANRRAVLGLLAPGVAPIAEGVARNIPDLFALFRSVAKGFGVPESKPEPEDVVLDRAATIRFVTSLVRNEELFAEVRHLATFVDERKQEIVDEWPRVWNYIQRAIRSDAGGPDAAAQPEGRTAAASEAE
jgi:hypothetical protein